MVTRVVVVGIGWHVQSLSQVAVAGHPEPSHCSLLPGVDLAVTAERAIRLQGLSFGNFLAFTVTVAD